MVTPHLMKGEGKQAFLVNKLLPHFAGRSGGHETDKGYDERENGL